MSDTHVKAVLDLEHIGGFEFVLTCSDPSGRQASKSFVVTASQMQGLYTKFNILSERAFRSLGVVQLHDAD